jgi:hypothetical protein
MSKYILKYISKYYYINLNSSFIKKKYLFNSLFSVEENRPIHVSINIYYINIE